MLSDLSNRSVFFVLGLLMWSLPSYVLFSLLANAYLKQKTWKTTAVYTLLFHLSSLLLLLLLSIPPMMPFLSLNPLGLFLIKLLYHCNWKQSLVLFLLQLFASFILGALWLVAVVLLFNAGMSASS
jgi:hypothetical protein